MPSKEQVHSNDKGVSKQPSPKPATSNFDILAQQQSHPVAILQRAMIDPGALTPRDVLQLQRTVGNRVVGQLLARIRSHPPVQAKLMVGATGDRYEQEADRVADQVMSMPRPADVQRPGVHKSPGAQRQEDEELQTKPLVASITPLAQRQADEGEEIRARPLVQRQAEEEEEVQTKPLAQRQAEEEEEVQTKPCLQPSTADLQASFEAGSEIESRLAASKGGGSPLPDEVRATMEPRFGADFSGVRLHTGGEAAQLSQDLSIHRSTIQRLPDLLTFQRHTRVGLTMRRKVTQIDNLLDPYHALPMNNYTERVNHLTLIILECNTYLGYPDQSAKRKEGVRWLLPQAQKELQIFQKLQQYAAAAGNAEKFKRGNEARNEVMEAVNLGYQVDDVSLHIDQMLMELLQTMRETDQASIAILINEHLDALQAMAHDPTAPNETRLVINEVLANRGIIHFAEGMSGSNRVVGGPPGPKAYDVGVVLNPTLLSMGEAERLGTLTHELTHVSAGESFDNTMAFLLHDPNTPISEIVNLAQERLAKVQRLEVLCQNDRDFSPDQRALLESKLDYVKGNQLERYKSKFSEAAERNPEGPKSLVGRRYKAVAERLSFILLAVPEGNSTLVEYDPVINQMLIYMHMWHIRHDNPFYKELRALATEAYQARAAARMPAVPGV